MKLILTTLTLGLISCTPKTTQPKDSYKSIDNYMDQVEQWGVI